jgi:hypothetical protein
MFLYKCYQKLSFGVFSHMYTFFLRLLNIVFFELKVVIAVNVLSVFFLFELCFFNVSGVRSAQTFTYSSAKNALKAQIDYIVLKKEMGRDEVRYFRFLMKIPIQLPPLNHLFSLSYLIFLF